MIRCHRAPASPPPRGKGTSTRALRNEARSAADSEPGSGARMNSSRTSPRSAGPRVVVARLRLPAGLEGLMVRSSPGRGPQEDRRPPAPGTILSRGGEAAASAGGARRPGARGAAAAASRRTACRRSRTAPRGRRPPAPASGPGAARRPGPLRRRSSRSASGPPRPPCRRWCSRPGRPSAAPRAARWSGWSPLLPGARASSRMPSTRATSFSALLRLASGSSSVPAKAPGYRSTSAAQAAANR